MLIKFSPWEETKQNVVSFQPIAIKVYIQTPPFLSENFHDEKSDASVHKWLITNPITIFELPLSLSENFKLPFINAPIKLLNFHPIFFTQRNLSFLTPTSEIFELSSSRKLEEVLHGSWRGFERSEDEIDTTNNHPPDLEIKGPLDRCNYHY